ncbi:DUF2095 domain-containing protein [Candidatus Thorarchaeota archaeon]|nr:DUF2095 family protein [Candidatus Thorarchaeota archaeon]TFG96454.1 MAG: DUF2095 domain-containing protein [Candidatus Thorarchaeota archaeon]
MSEDEEFRRNFPALSTELEEGNTQEFIIDGVRTVSEESESKEEEKIDYTPDVVDYIRRCDTLTQANEIVDFLAKQGEISEGQAKAIKSQLKSDGIRSFGAKKEKDHYLHHGFE